MPWLQLFVTSEKKDAHSVENALLSLGALSVTLQESIPEGEEEQPILEPELNETPLWDTIKVTGLFDADCNTKRISETLQSKLPISSRSTRWEQLEDKDWEREWMSNYHPIQISGSLWICPSWCTPPQPEAINIMLDPGLAFGTGTHPTTFLCMQWLDKQDLNNKTLIDYGCGSGILGVTGLLLGAEAVTGIDIDPQALTATHDNVIRNQLPTAKFPVYLPQQKPDLDKVDIVVANILAGPLVELMDTLLTHLKPGGHLCLSGILASQSDQVIESYKKHIKFEPSSQKEEWIQLSGQLKTSYYS